MAKNDGGWKDQKPYEKGREPHEKGGRSDEWKKGGDRLRDIINVADRRPPPKRPPKDDE